MTRNQPLLLGVPNPKICIYLLGSPGIGQHLIAKIALVALIVKDVVTSESGLWQGEPLFAGNPFLIAAKWRGFGKRFSGG